MDIKIEELHDEQSAELSETHREEREMIHVKYLRKHFLV
jgi:hypothetical protein